MISPAFAQAPGAGSGGFDIISLFPIVAMVAIFYLLLFRPQQKRLKEHQERISAVRRGDIIVTAGGIIGKVIRVGTDNELGVEIADGVRVRVVKSTISEVRGKTEPLKEKRAAEPVADNDDEASPPTA